MTDIAKRNELVEAMAAQMDNEADENFSFKRGGKIVWENEQ